MGGLAQLTGLLLALAAVITAVTNFIKVSQVHDVVTKTASDVAVVKQQTNGHTNEEAPAKE